MVADLSVLNPFERWIVSANKPQFNAISGAIGGFTSGIITCPLDVIKTRLQAGGGFTPVSKGRHVGHEKVYRGLGGTFQTIWRTEGVRGLYRGLGPIVMGYLPTWGVWFTVYDLCKIRFREYHDNEFLVNLGSSLVAGGTSTIATNPIWVIKTRLMSQSVSHRPGRHYSQFPKSANTPTSRPIVHTSHYHSTLDAAYKMYTTEGIVAFYSGLTPALLGLSHVAVQFPAYEYLKKKFTGQGMGGLSDENNTWSNWLGTLSATILSKILASSATYPHEVIRTRLQTQRRPVAGAEYLQGLGIKPPQSGGNGEAQGAPGKQRPAAPKYRGVVRTFRTILAEEGWRAFYAGMGTNMMRAVPSATVTMLTYELMMSQLYHTKRMTLKKLDIEEDLSAGF
ncbi:hypothetical protein ACRALDRAFT_2098292 [Sodiomyces alcalophilus JCM 7366]|uniref:uncharacterized protein n=1 Tax=Sodiomyces alcalophilus JCM 7366 TaxID=591952 RepID=UPI0039B5A2DE